MAALEAERLLAEEEEGAEDANEKLKL